MPSPSVKRRVLEETATRRLTAKNGETSGPSTSTSAGGSNPRESHLLSLACALAFSAACASGNYGSAQVTQQLGDPAAVINLRTGISIPEGAAASANVQMVAVDGDDLSGNLKSADPSIMLVAPSSTNPNIYVFIGVTTGLDPRADHRERPAGRGDRAGDRTSCPRARTFSACRARPGVTEGPDGGEGLERGGRRTERGEPRRLEGRRRRLSWRGRRG